MSLAMAPLFKSSQKFFRGGVSSYLALIGIYVLVAVGSCYAQESHLLSLSLRTRVSSATTLGQQQPEEFEEVDLAALFGLPWQRYRASGWGVGSQVMASFGVIRGAGESGLVVSLIPGLACGSRDRRFTLDAGAGFALLSRYTFGTQDFGGPFQFALTAGAGLPLYQRMGLGYRFVHYSDAAVNGSDTIGADFHMLEISYRY